MTLEQAIIELKKYAKELTDVGDAKEFIKNNKEEFIHRWTKVLQYYNYALKKVDVSSEQFDEIVDIMNDIAVENPSLEPWVYEIQKPASEVRNEQNDNKSNIKVEEIVNQANYLIELISNMQSWDTEVVTSIDSRLREYLRIITNNKEAFNEEIYENLTTNINKALSKISKFNDMLDSDAMQGIMRM